uniref:Bm1091 n=1 Tax=Brugia malayi TaxID=6279 RepID=A0A1I9G6Q1_BRUMA|nr:Bm1091 [Brugia malayi]
MLSAEVVAWHAASRSAKWWCIYVSNASAVISFFQGRKPSYPPLSVTSILHLSPNFIYFIQANQSLYQSSSTTSLSS